MGILALDLAKKTGYALSRPDKPPLFGTVVIERGTVGENQGRAYAELRRWLTGMIKMTHPDSLIIEAPNSVTGRSAATAQFLMGVCAIAEEAAWACNVPIVQANVVTVRKAVIGSGHCGKDGAMAYCQRRGWRVEDDNQADALVLLTFAGGA